MSILRCDTDGTIMATSPIKDMDTTQVIVDYLHHNPASAHLVNAPLDYLSQILKMYTRELKGLLVFYNANIKYCARDEE